jgi:serine/threonine protein kinase
LICSPADFGLTKRIRRENSEIRTSFIGTPYYAAPEVIKEG